METKDTEIKQTVNNGTEIKQTENNDTEIKQTENNDTEIKQIENIDTVVTIEEPVTNVEPTESKRSVRVSSDKGLKKPKHTNWFRIHWRALFLYFAPIVFLPVILIYKNPESKCAYVLVLMLTYWISEALPLGVTGLLPVVFFPLFKILPSSEVSKEYLCDSNLEYLAGLLMAIAFSTSGLDQLIAFRILLLIGTKPKRITYGVLFTTMIISVYNGSTGAVAIMIPIVQAVLEAVDIRTGKDSATELSEEFNEIFDFGRSETTIAKEWIQAPVEIPTQKSEKPRKTSRQRTNVIAKKKPQTKTKRKSVVIKREPATSEILQNQLNTMKLLNVKEPKGRRSTVTINPIEVDPSTPKDPSAPKDPAAPKDPSAPKDPAAPKDPSAPKTGVTTRTSLTKTRTSLTKSRTSLTKKDVAENPNSESKPKKIQKKKKKPARTINTTNETEIDDANNNVAVQDNKTVDDGEIPTTSGWFPTAFSTELPVDNTVDQVPATKSDDSDESLVELNSVDLSEIESRSERRIDMSFELT